MGRILREDPRLGKLVAHFPWLARGAGYGYEQTLQALYSLYFLGKSLTLEVAAMPWLAEAQYLSYYRHENPLREVDYIARGDRALGKQLARLLIGDMDQRDRDLLHSLYFLAQDEGRVFKELTRQPWMRDGLDDAEMAFLVTSLDLVKDYPDDYALMLESRHVEAGAVDLPLSGVVNVWVIGSTPAGEGDTTVPQLLEAVKYLEELTRVPFPTRRVIVLSIDSESDSQQSASRSGPAFAGKYIRMSGDQHGSLDPYVLYQTISNYYFYDDRHWFFSSGIDFAADYVDYRTGRYSGDQWRERVEKEKSADCLYTPED